MANNTYSVHCPKLPWMIDFHSAAECEILNSQLRAAFAENFTEHLVNLDVHSQRPKRKLTGIICRLGNCCDCSCNAEKLLQMMDAGMTMIVIKMIHFDYEDCIQAFKLIREANDDYSRKIGRIYPLAIGLDITGPEIHTGSFADPDVKELEFFKGNLVNLTSDPAYEEHVTKELIYVDYNKINEVIEPGSHIIIDNGELQLEALKVLVGYNRIRCRVEKGGKLTRKANVSLPGAPIDLPLLSKKDKEDLKFAVENNVDAVFIPGVRDYEMATEAREELGEEGKHLMVITKLDNCCALCSIDDIIKLSDAILIDRAALGAEISTEKIFLAQKSVIAKCNKLGKPVICASQLLKSMIKNKEPTKSEASDIANCILDGADCLMLSKETSFGEYPVETVDILSTICKEAEAAVYQKQVFLELAHTNQLTPIEPIYAVSISAVETSLKCNAAAIIVLTTTGRAAKVVAQFRPRCPIIAITRFGHVARQLHLFRALDPIYYISPLKADWQKDIDQRVQLGITWGKVSGFIRAGDAIVILTGSKPGSGFTNSMQVVYASAFDTTTDCQGDVCCNCD